MFQQVLKDVTTYRSTLPNIVSRLDKTYILENIETPNQGETFAGEGIIEYFTKRLNILSWLFDSFF